MSDGQVSKISGGGLGSCTVPVLSKMFLMLICIMLFKKRLFRVPRRDPTPPPVRG